MQGSEDVLAMPGSADGSQRGKRLFTNWIPADRFGRTILRAMYRIVIRSGFPSAMDLFRDFMNPEVLIIVFLDVTSICKLFLDNSPVVRNKMLFCSEAIFGF